MARREIGEINAGSMADIAFLLLIFFLVTTTMDVDSGIARKLPEKTEQQSDVIVKEKNVLDIVVNRNNQLLEDLIKFLNPNTKLCIAANINHPTEEFIKTLKISDWKNKKPELHKIPAVFVLGK